MLRSHTSILFKAKFFEVQCLPDLFRVVALCNISQQIRLKMAFDGNTLLKHTAGYGHHYYHTAVLSARPNFCKASISLPSSNICDHVGDSYHIARMFGRITLEKCCNILWCMYTTTTTLWVRLQSRYIHSFEVFEHKEITSTELWHVQWVETKVQD